MARKALTDGSRNKHRRRQQALKYNKTLRTYKVCINGDYKMYTRRSNANGSQFNLPHGTKNILETKIEKKLKKPVSMLVKNQTFTATLLVASDSDDKVD